MYWASDSYKPFSVRKNYNLLGNRWYRIDIKLPFKLIHIGLSTPDGFDDFGLGILYDTSTGLEIDLGYLFLTFHSPAFCRLWSRARKFILFIFSENYFNAVIGEAFRDI